MQSCVVSLRDLRKKKSAFVFPLNNYLQRFCLRKCNFSKFKFGLHLLNVNVVFTEQTVLGKNSAILNQHRVCIYYNFD